MTNKNNLATNTALILAQSLEYLEIARIRCVTVNSAGFDFALKYDIVKLAYYFTKIVFPIDHKVEIGCIATSLLELTLAGTQLKLTAITQDSIAQLPPVLLNSISQAILADCEALTAQMKAFALSDNKYN